MAVTGLNLWIRELGEQDGETCGSIQTMTASRVPDQAGLLDMTSCGK